MKINVWPALGCVIQRTQSTEIQRRRGGIGKMLLKNTTRPQKIVVRETGTNCWDRVKKPLTDFHGCWVNAQRVWQSGMSDDQVTDKALELWAGSHDGKVFALVHMWKVVRDEQKWAAYLVRLKKEQEKEKSAKANTNPSVLVNLELDGEKRPMGHKKAKNERNGKKKATDEKNIEDVPFDLNEEATTSTVQAPKAMTQ